MGKHSTYLALIAWLEWREQKTAKEITQSGVDARIKRRML